MNSSRVTRPSHRRPRFSLLTLLVLVTVIGIVLGLVMREWHGALREKQAAAEVRRLGGGVRLGNPPEANGVISGWLHLLLGDEYFVEVSSVGWRLRSEADLDLLRAFPKMTRLSLTGPAVTDAALGRLTGLGQLEQLSLKDAAIGEPGLKSLTCLPNLHALRFQNCSLTHEAGDLGLRSLAELPNLQALAFSDCALSDDNLKALRGARSLVDLSLYEANISDVGFAELQQALPNCKIRR